MPTPGSTPGGSTTGGTSTPGGSTTGGTSTPGGATTGGGGRTAGGATTGGSSGIFGGLFGGGGSAGGTPVDRSAGDCCKGDDCGACVTMPPATMSGAQRGPFGGSGLFGSARSVELAGGTTYVPPEDAKGPWAGFAIIPGFTNTGPEMEDWGPFFASWGIVTVITNSGALDTPGLRGQWLLDAIADLKEANTRNSTLMGKLSGNYGTGGYSMGGGGTTNASSSDSTLRSSIGLAPWTPIGRGITTPTIHFCGTVDLVADCSHAQASYDDIPAATPKALVTVSGCDHLLCWFGPADATGGISGELGLIWNKVYLEGDNRWKAMLTNKLKDGLSAAVQTNVK